MPLLLLFQLLFGKEIDENTARLVGQNFLLRKTNYRIAAGNRILLQRVYLPNARAQRTNSTATPDAATYFYIFNVNTTGFVIIAGDDGAIPILGYSEQRTFPSQDLPQNVAKWLEGYKNQIRHIITNHLPASDRIKEEWNALRVENAPNNSPNERTTAVNPLVPTQWNQSPFFNALCPGGSVTGCVATAMAQVMKYWNYPSTGSGFHSYNHQTYGTLSANLAAPPTNGTPCRTW